MTSFGRLKNPPFLLKAAKGSGGKMKIYVGNLPWSIDENGLKDLFASFAVEEVALIKDKFSGRSKGFGFVTISDDEEAKKAISELNDKEVDGRKLKISEAKPMEAREDRPRRSFGGGNRGGGFGGNRGGGFGGGRGRY
jgi:RNA recognition motif-containing protein